MAVGAYFVLPLMGADAADYACMTAATGDGTYSVRWIAAPPAHWSCSITPEGGSERVRDLGWWPSTT